MNNFVEDIIEGKTNELYESKITTQDIITFFEYYQELMELELKYKESITDIKQLL